MMISSTKLKNPRKKADDLARANDALGRDLGDAKRKADDMKYFIIEIIRRNLDDLNNSPDNPKKLKDDLDRLRKEK